MFHEGIWWFVVLWCWFVVVVGVVFCVIIQKLSVMKVCSVGDGMSFVV